MGFRNWLGSAGGALFGALPVCATACSLAPSAYDLETFLKQRDSLQVVILARVVAVENLSPRPQMLSEQKVEFEVLRSWRGGNQPSIVTTIVVGEPSGISCSGIGNFQVKLRQRWLLVGSYDNTGFRPSALKSKLLPDGVLPAETLKLLESSK